MMLLIRVWRRTEPSEKSKIDTKGFLSGGKIKQGGGNAIAEASSLNAFDYSSTSFIFACLPGITALFEDLSCGSASCGVDTRSGGTVIVCLSSLWPHKCKPFSVFLTVIELAITIATILNKSNNYYL